MKSNRAKANPLSPIEDVTSRNIPWPVRTLLAVRAGGICEFDGCRNYLLEHPLTLTAGNFAEVAHIVAFKPDGPRGQDGERPININDADNLMLLCPTCHKLVDDHPTDYTRKTLEEYKRAHEQRIRHLTSLSPDRKTAVLVLRTPIRGDAVAIPFDQVAEATSPRYPISREGCVIDLTTVEDHGVGFVPVATETIAERVRRFLDQGGEARKASHVSVFALAPMPLLVYLGRQLTNKIPCDVFQRHRDTEDWTWKTDGTSVQYLVRQIREGRRDRAALVLSLSGTVPLAHLPADIAEASVYEITLDGVVPAPTFLRLKADLDAFRVAYQEAIGLIIKNHGLLDTIDLFPAVPAPIAVLCGRELLPKVHPGLRVFDYNNQRNGFTFQLEVK
jgi:hypothetical protein